MEVVTAGAQDELMQSLDYKLKTSNTSYVTARHNVQFFPSSLSTFSPATARVCRIPLTSGTSFIDPETIKIAFRVRNTDATNPLAPATPNPACFIQRVQVFANGGRCDDINYYGRTVAVHDLLKGREYNRNKAMEGFDEVNDPRIARAVHQNGYADVLMRPTMVGILRCGKMLPPQLNLVLEIEFADATTALWSENAGAHPAGATLSTDFEIQNVQVLASQVVLDSHTPEGLPGLDPKNQRRVDVDNAACAWILGQLQAIADDGRGALRENPARSLHWSLPQEETVMESGLWYDTTYSACVFMSARCKHQRLRHNIREIELIHPRECHHQHAAWEWDPWEDTQGRHQFPSKDAGRVLQPGAPLRKVPRVQLPHGARAWRSTTSPSRAPSRNSW